MNGTPEDEDIFQASVADRRTGPTDPDLQDGVAGRHGSTHDSRYRCSDPACANISFGLKKDLTRHEKEHDAINWWKCGCCQNLGYTTKRKRRYPMQQHLERTHQREESTHRGDKVGEECPEEGCKTLFIGASCLFEHMRQEHPLSTREMPSRAIDGK